MSSCARLKSFPWNHHLLSLHRSSNYLRGQVSLSTGIKTAKITFPRFESLGLVCSFQHTKLVIYIQVIQQFALQSCPTPHQALLRHVEVTMLLLGQGLRSTRMTMDLFAGSLLARTRQKSPGCLPSKCTRLFTLNLFFISSLYSMRLVLSLSCVTIHIFPDASTQNCGFQRRFFIPKDFGHESFVGLSQSQPTLKNACILESDFWDYHTRVFRSIPSGTLRSQNDCLRQIC